MSDHMCLNGRGKAGFFSDYNFESPLEWCFVLFANSNIVLGSVPTLYIPEALLDINDKMILEITFT